MQIDLYHFLIELYFKPPLPVESYKELGIQYEGFEKHLEEMYASSEEVASRAMGKFVRRRIGRNRSRLLTLDIRLLTEEEYVKICKEAKEGSEESGG